MHWSESAVFYHIYPLGFCNAPERNPGDLEPHSRILEIRDWIGTMESLGVDALYLGPLFESVTHGYDTVDYRSLDRRLGTNADLKSLVEELRGRGIRVVFDAVLNHVSRRFFAFQDVLEKEEESPYWNWFSGMSREGSTPIGDPFTYDTWDGHYELVKLDHGNPDVRGYLLEVVEGWIREFGISGLRLDAADVIPGLFLRELRSHCASLDGEFWLLGEIVHGDYTRLANEETLHSVTNYECYKGLYSSHNDGNYFEIAHSLKRQFQEPGIYSYFHPYNFADNHDVDRVASSLKERSHLYPLHILLFGMPGVPSVYYGSEWGIEGAREPESDAPLRPSMEEVNRRPERDDTLFSLISRLAALRKEYHALQSGDYREILVDHRQLAFLRECETDQVVVAVNASEEEAALELPMTESEGVFVDLLNGTGERHVADGTLRCTVLPHWGTLLGRRR
ncbi:MAG: alpha-amylase family glycosyl hydrolase [Spirochaetaceae bacterium]